MGQNKMDPSERFLSRATCRALAKRVAGMATNGGESRVQVDTTSTGNVRFARNQIRTSGDVRNNLLTVWRDVNGAFAWVNGNQTDDVSLMGMVLRTERLLAMFKEEEGDIRFQDHSPSSVNGLGSEFLDLTRNAVSAATNSSNMVLANVVEPHTEPKIFFDSTYNFDPANRAAAVDPLVASARNAGMYVAGYIEAKAQGAALIDTWGHDLYYPQTIASFTVTVRTPDGSASGWAGVNWNDWNRVDAVRMSEIALDKCQRSRNPVRLEPGRYTVVLEPQAVHDIFWPVVISLDRLMAEGTPGDKGSLGVGVFARGTKSARFGERVLDSRITVSQDPMDPDCSSMPFDLFGNVYHAATWIEKGVLVNLPYYRNYGIQVLGKNSGLPNSYAYRMSGGSATLDDMIKSTERGVYVTRFWQVQPVDNNTLLCTGYTRDGTWLIERGAITKPIKNFRFTESPMFAFNKVDALGPTQRVYALNSLCPAAVVPSAKISDFSFTGLTDAV